MLKKSIVLTTALVVAGSVAIDAAVAQTAPGARPTTTMAPSGAPDPSPFGNSPQAGMVSPGALMRSDGPATPLAMAAPPGKVVAPPSTKPGQYVDPKRGFFVPVPPGARVIELAGKAGLSVQSRRGYAINLQTGDSSPSTGLASMVAKLDERYLGDGKPWTSKLMESETTVAGMEARQALYEAGPMRVRLVIARAKRTDFVFMFFAPKQAFERLHPEFEWLLGHFQAAADDRPDTVAVAAPAPGAATSAAKPLHAAPKASAMADGRPAPAAPTPAVKNASQRFNEPGFGYAIDFPADWEMEKSAAYTAIFSGRQGTSAYDAIVSVQNVQPAKSGKPEDAVRMAFQDLKSQLGKTAAGLEFDGEKAVSYSKRGVTLAGRQFVATYNHGGRVYRKWALVLPRPTGDVAHVWSYTAPANRFDAYRPVAENMLRSWIIAN